MYLREIQGKISFERYTHGKLSKIVQTADEASFKTSPPLSHDVGTSFFQRPNIRPDIKMTMIRSTFQGNIQFTFF